MLPGADTMNRIERLNYLLGALCVVGALILGDRAMVGGVMVGVAITCLNFFVMKKLGLGLTRHVAAGGSPSRAILLLPKSIALMAIVALALIYLPVSPVGFIIGFSIILVSITTEAVLSTLRAPDPADDPPGDPAPTNPDEIPHG